MKREKKAKIAAAVVGLAGIAAGAYVASKSESYNMRRMREYYGLPKGANVPTIGFDMTPLPRPGLRDVAKRYAQKRNHLAAVDVAIRAHDSTVTLRRRRDGPQRRPRDLRQDYSDLDADADLLLAGGGGVHQDIAI